ncbi:MAG: hypothetical protein JNL97_11635 [Verrucomicrobiales bacterium]|nr:hypothetical protein [Verrucomicrobiales bacterium]
MNSAHPKTLSSLVAFLAVRLAASGQIFSVDFEVGASIPDDTSTGIADIRTVRSSGSSIEGLSVRLELSADPGFSAFLGDLYAYVEHAGTISVLLNRPGRTPGTPWGYPDDRAMEIQFSDGGPDIHAYRPIEDTPLSVPLLGTFGPDGRASDPAVVLDSDERTLLLDAFDGRSPDGDWTLFVADLSGGGRHRLVGWSLQFELTAIPELPTWIPAAGLLAGGCFLRRRRQCPAPSPEAVRA